MIRQKYILPIALIIICLTLSFCGGGGSSDGTSDPTPVDSESPVLGEATPTVATGKVWTVPEVMGEPRSGGRGQNVSCGGEFGFKRCVCVDDVPSSVRYRPALAECNGNAAVFLSGRLLDIFSVVVRDSQNRDRFPEAGSGFGGCSFSEANSDDPPKKCSAFKVQDSFETIDGTYRVHCFGASGYSEIFADAVRLTLKITDSPFSNDDELERYCLVSGDKPLN